MWMVVGVFGFVEFVEDCCGLEDYVFFFDWIEGDFGCLNVLCFGFVYYDWNCFLFRLDEKIF